MRSVLLAALLVGPAFAAETPAPTAAKDTGPLSLLTDSFGEPGVETLASRGVIVLQGKPAARRLAAIHWKSFGTLTQAMSSCLALTSAADALGHEPVQTAPTLDLSVCRALPPDGMMTPSLHALAAALEAAHEERWALHLASASPTGVPSMPNLYDTAWGKDLIARRHADVLENPAVLVKPVFDDLLAGPRPDKDAAALFAAEASARGAVSPETLLAYDGDHGALSEELRAQLRRTLSNERRRWAAAKARATAADLLGNASVKRELEALRNVAKSLSSRPNLSSALEAAASRSPASGHTRLKSAGLHLQEPTRLGQHELGDTAIISGAYWVDGLKENDSVEIEESLVVETERGFSSVETRSYKRRNGGPYPYARTIKITETRPFAVRSIVSGAGSNALIERVEVPLARDFEMALIKEAEAAGLRATCRLKDAEAAYLSLETLVTEPAKIKPQYQELAVRARKAREATKLENETSIKLEEGLAAARADSAPQLCRYETNRVDEALKLAKRLPVGCDRDLPELHALRAMITRRAADQKWFLKASSDARSKRKSCELNAARARWSEALASLDGDPGARCGRVAEEEGRAKTEFAELTRKIAWREELGKSLSKAEAETSPARRLDIIRPVTSRLGDLKSDCLDAETKRAAALANAASKILTAPADTEMERRLPPVSALASAITEVRAERAQRLEAATAAEKATVEPATAPAAKTSATVNTPKPAAKAKPAKPKKKGAAAK